MYLIASVSLDIYFKCYVIILYMHFLQIRLFYIFLPLLSFSVRSTFSSFFLPLSNSFSWVLSPISIVTLTKTYPPYLHTRDHACHVPLKCSISCNYLYDNSWRLGNFPAIYDCLYLWETSPCLTSCKWMHVYIRAHMCPYGLITPMLMTACIGTCVFICICVCCAYDLRAGISKWMGHVKKC